MRTRGALAALALALTAAACSGPRAAASGAPSQEMPGAERRAVEVASHGALEITVPSGWSLAIRPGDPPMPVTLELARRGSRFVLRLTPLWEPARPGEGADPATAQALAELARRAALRGATERDIALEELRGEAVQGYFFAATGRGAGDPSAGESYSHVVQGAAAVGELLVAFSLRDDGPGPHRETALEVVRGARHVRATAGDAEPDANAFVPDPDAETVPLSLGYPGRSWTLLVDLPGFRMFRPRTTDAGKTVFVLGEHPASGIVASVILRDGAAGVDARACRERDLGRLRQLPGISDLRLSGEGPAVRVEYLASEAGRARQRHAHAWIARDGVCANVHVSKTAPARDDAARLLEILSTVRFGEML